VARKRREIAFARDSFQKPDGKLEFRRVPRKTMGGIWNHCGCFSKRTIGIDQEANSSPATDRKLHFRGFFFKNLTGYRNPPAFLEKHGLNSHLLPVPGKKPVGIDNSGGSLEKTRQEFTRSRVPGQEPTGNGISAVFLFKS